MDESDGPDTGIGPRDWRAAAFAMFAVGWGANQFAPMLLVYTSRSGLSQAVVTAMFGVYALGLIPTLLLAGSFSDRRGRRSVMRPVLVLSFLATLVMLLGAVHPWWLFPGRLLAGIASGAAFGAGSAWVRELSTTAAPGSGARRAAVALSGGFGAGALVAGILAQFLPAPVISPYLAHLVITAIALAWAWRAPDPYVPARGGVAVPLIPDGARRRRFLLGVAPWAPWVFGCATISFAVIPAQSGTAAGSRPVAFAGVVAGLTLLTGVAVQPAARRLATSSAPWRVPVSGLAAGVLGLCGGAVVTSLHGWALAPLLLLPVAVVLGAAYGTLLVGGLVEVELQSGPHDHARLVAVYYALTYLGFAAPYLFAQLAAFGGVRPWLLAAAAVCLVLIPTTIRSLAQSPARN